MTAAYTKTALNSSKTGVLAPWEITALNGILTEINDPRIRLYDSVEEILPLSTPTV